jgi:hypothetical protein
MGFLSYLSRGDWHSFEPLVARFVAAALDADIKVHDAERLNKLIA